MLKSLDGPDIAAQAVRDNVRDRVLWLAISIIHWANHVRPNPDGSKVGGHQSSSASSAALLAALFFETMDASDRVAIKPHASPVFHAIQYLLGNLSEEYLERFRAFGGLQAYPSRTKDPDSADFSTGSVGLGGPSAAFGALARDYLDARGLDAASGHFFAHIGDAELDEGSTWEAVAEPALAGIGRCAWIVDVNRQSLDRVVPGIKIARFEEMFAVNGWTVITAKYGEELSELMARPGGHALRRRVDEMSNEEYQGMLIAPVESVRERLIGGAGSLRRELERCVSGVDDAELARRLANLGGHDIGTLVRAYREASRAPGPAAVFAYTVKGWGLQSAADPRNHAALLTESQYRQIAGLHGIDPNSPWQRFPEDSPEAEYIRKAAQRLRRPEPVREPPIKFNPTSLGVPETASTQDAFGRMLVELDRTSPDAAGRMVTISPDVATSTNLSSWINRVSLWSSSEQDDFLNFEERTVRWISRPTGRHIELALSETNMFILLGQLGLAEELSGKRLIPIGTVYDPFVARGLDPLVHAAYQESKFIAVATPSGVSLSTEGGAHQGVVTPGIMTQLPGTVYYEPCFARELEWIMHDAVSRIGSGEGESLILRLSTKPVRQSLMPAPTGKAETAALRRSVLDGCHRLRQASAASQEQVHLFAVGPMVPEAIEAAGMLETEGVGANVFSVTSPDMLHRGLRRAARAELQGEDQGAFDPTGLLGDGETGRPVVTVMDGHPHTMSFLGAALDCPSVNLGVDAFGQSGDRADLYRHFGIDADGIYAAALGIIDRQRRRRV